MKLLENLQIIDHISIAVTESYTHDKPLIALDIELEQEEGFLNRFLARWAAYFSFARMKIDYPENIEEYKGFLESKTFPENKKGWRIFRKVYGEMFGKVHENQ